MRLRFLLIGIILAMVFLAVASVSAQSDAESNCLSSGGSIGTENCCLSTNNFPNTCTIGACACSENYSHSIQTCNCPPGTCFDGNTCASQVRHSSEDLSSAQSCSAAQGHWTECGSRCQLDNQGKTGIACPAICEALCECGGIAGFGCPEGYICQTPAGVTDALGYCVSSASADSGQQAQVNIYGRVVDHDDHGQPRNASNRGSDEGRAVPIPPLIVHENPSNITWFNLSEGQCAVNGCVTACAVYNGVGHPTAMPPGFYGIRGQMIHQAIQNQIDRQRRIEFNSTLNLQMIHEDYRNVSAFVHFLQDERDNETLWGNASVSLGPMVSNYAEDFNATLLAQMRDRDRIETRDPVTRFFFGGDAGAAANLSENVNATLLKIQTMEQALSDCSTCDPEVVAALQDQLQQMQAQQFQILNQTQAEASDHGWFGWIFH